MKVHQLLEGNFRGHGYDLGNYPTSRDHGLAHLYNMVIPNLSRIFKIPVANFKVRSDHGYGWQAGTLDRRPYSTEKCLMRVVLRKKGLDIELISTMLPKALKAELSKQLVDVDVKLLSTTDGYHDTVYMKDVPPCIDLSFSSKYPDEWVKIDKERYGIRW